MTEYTIRSVDPWLHNGTGRDFPKSAAFICAYDLNLGVDSIAELAFLSRDSIRDELWLLWTYGSGSNSDLLDLVARGEERRLRAVALQIGVGASKTRESDARASALALLEALFSARIGFAWPTGFDAGGLLDEPAFTSLVSGLKHALERQRDDANATETAIIATCRRLGLNPEPTGTDQRFWRARCPRRGHWIAINADANEFGCGYCREKGGPAQLVDFHARLLNRQNSVTGP